MVIAPRGERQRARLRWAASGEDDVNGTNDPVSASLIGRLISRVQALYKH
jgi:hypothetical protein